MLEQAHRSIFVAVFLLITLQIDCYGAFTFSDQCNEVNPLDSQQLLLSASACESRQGHCQNLKQECSKLKKLLLPGKIIADYPQILFAAVFLGYVSIALSINNFDQDLTGEKKRSEECKTFLRALVCKFVSDDYSQEFERNFQIMGPGNGLLTSFFNLANSLYFLHKDPRRAWQLDGWYEGFFFAVRVLAFFSLYGLTSDLDSKFARFDRNFLNDINHEYLNIGLFQVLPTMCGERIAHRLYRSSIARRISQYPSAEVEQTDEDNLSWLSVSTEYTASMYDQLR